MSGILNVLSSWLGMRKPSPAPERETRPPVERKAASPSVSETELRSWDREKLTSFLASQPERGVLRILSSLGDADLQVRLVQAVTDESALKRVLRSQLSKKVKRAAAKALETTDGSKSKVELKTLTGLIGRMHSFFARPDWETAEDLLLEARSAEPGAGLEKNAVHEEFILLRARLAKDVEAHQRTRTELEELCLKLETVASVSPRQLTQLSEKGEELCARYPLARSLGLRKRFEDAVGAARDRSEKADRARKAAVQAEETRQREEREKQRAQDQEERARLFESLRVKAREVEQNLTHPQTRLRLRELQDEVARLGRFRQEFGGRFEELETQVKTMASQRPQAVDEANWDHWARKDIALRIQAELEEKVSSLESEQDPAVALKNSVGLTAKLHEFAKEMRGLGHLGRGQDKEIWEGFKRLSDRGWAVCNRMKLLVLERTKTLLSEHSEQPIDFASADPAASLRLKPSAFEGEVPELIKELRLFWLEIGSRSAEENRDLERVFVRLFEQYSRQLNLRLGRTQKAEAAVVQARQDLLKEMKLNIESKATLVSRARVAKTIETKWASAQVPSAGMAELQSEFEGQQAKINGEIVAALQEGLKQAESLFGRATDVLSKLRGDDKAGLPQLQKALASVESELQALEKNQGSFRGLEQRLEAEKRAVVDASFAVKCAEVKGALGECRGAIKKELDARAKRREALLEETELLATSADWETARKRIGELREQWKSAGALGQSQDAAYGWIFESVCEFFDMRFAGKDATQDQEKLRATRDELVFTLEALCRLRKPSAAFKTNRGAVPIPLADADVKGGVSGRLLEAGLRCRQALALDPENGVAKETRKAMEGWNRLSAMDADSLAQFWGFYLDRVHLLLEIP